MKAIFVLYCIFIILVKIIVSKDAFSYLDSLIDDTEDNDVKYDSQVFRNLEEIYLSYFFFKTDKEDSICTLNDNKKRALCELVFSLNHYKSLDVKLNKVALYLQKLSCEEKEVTIDYAVSSFIRNKKLKQKMFLCPGRHSIVQTSFIEDDHYDSYYLSDGPTKDSVMVYLYMYENECTKFSIYDLINNVKQSALQDIMIIKQDVITELKLNQDVHANFNYGEVEITYLLEQEYMKDDPVCNLEYEKKISLCTIIFNEIRKNKIDEIIMNKAAFSVFSLNCFVAPIHKLSTSFKMLLSEKQNVYPCYGQQEIPVTENYLLDVLMKFIYVSSGPKRNSILLYIYKISEEQEITFTLVGMIENINFKILKEITITVDEVKLESESTYNEVLEIIKSAEFHSHNQIMSVLMDNKLTLTNNEEEKSKLIEQLATQCEKDFNERNISIISNKEDSVSDKDTDTNETDNNNNLIKTTLDQIKVNTEIIDKEKKESQFIIMYQKEYNNNYNLQIGSQIFKMLIKKKIEEINTNIVDKSNITPVRIKKKLEQIKLKKEIELKEKRQKLNEEVKKLIKKMDLFIKTQNNSDMTLSERSIKKKKEKKKKK